MRRAVRDNPRLLPRGDWSCECGRQRARNDLWEYRLGHADLAQSGGKPQASVHLANGRPDGVRAWQLHRFCHPFDAPVALDGRRTSTESPCVTFPAACGVSTGHDQRLRQEARPGVPEATREPPIGSLLKYPAACGGVPLFVKVN